MRLSKFLVLPAPAQILLELGMRRLSVARSGYWMIHLSTVGYVHNLWLLATNFQIPLDLTQFNCDSDEEITALTIIPQINDTSVPLFCLGTMVYQADEREPAEGRLLILDARSVNGQSRSTNLQLSLVTSLNLKGCVYSLTIINGLIAAAVNASVCSSDIATIPVTD